MFVGESPSDETLKTPVSLRKMDDDWEPPTEASMKLLQARRERSDKISKMMGDYLLKGYKMLAVTCPDCDTILLQTKQGTKYCVACNELDSDADKDDPVTSQTAALAQARETEARELSSRPAAPTTPSVVPPPHRSPTSASHPPPALPHQGRMQSSDVVTAEIPTPFVTVDRGRFPLLNPGLTNTLTNTSGGGGEGGGVGGVWEGERCVRELLDKMDWAAAELRGAGSVEYSLQLCQLIKGCAEAVSSVRSAFRS
ncbi:protein ZNRD2-like [Babylonia areolata]|uniref:protein ZNRD2-like n=1 Tax=Babylonia areolata TaxID=304850 RepID=UPI003FD0C53C